jgi:hypothetical protein
MAHRLDFSSTIEPTSMNGAESFSLAQLLVPDPDVLPNIHRTGEDSETDSGF